VEGIIVHMPAVATAQVVPQIVLIGLDAALAHELNHSLPQWEPRIVEDPVLAGSDCADWFHRLRADLLFVAARYRHLKSLLALAREAGIPVVVISRFPDSKEWLDAMDAGATDYAAAPFEQHQMRWILDASLGAHESGFRLTSR
jgi:DNA-binding NtrC family response regulator